MNENFNGQMPINPQPNVAPVAPVAPVPPVAPAQPVAPVPPVAPAQPTAPVAPKQPMDKKQIMKYIGIGAGACVALSPVLPMVSMFGSSANLFDGEATLTAIVLMVLGVFAALTYVFGKAKRFSLVSGGGAFLLALYLLDSLGLDYLGFGWWIMMLGALALIVVSVMENLAELKSMFGSANSAPAPAPVAVPAAPVAPVVAPTVQQAVVCANCGQPKKNPMDQFCQSCGQRY